MFIPPVTSPCHPMSFYAMAEWQDKNIVPTWPQDDVQVKQT